jgi:GDP-mannose 4,6-dehydratase
MNVMISNKLLKCRICNNEDLTDAIDLNEQYITSRFPKYGDYTTPKTKITLCMCSSCGLIQLKETTNADELYGYEYGYRSGISNTMKEHLRMYQNEILNKVTLLENDIVIDIGSNDSTMLQLYPEKNRRIGVDPTGSQFKQYYKTVELLPTYFTHENVVEAFGNIKAKIISSISMFYDLPDPVKFAKDIFLLLDDEGVWTCEQSYLLTMLERNSIDTICHEHLEYYALKQIKEIADRSNFKIIDVKFNDCNGGSFRIYFAKKENKTHEECTELINSILQNEINYGIMNLETYKNFMKRCDVEVNKLQKFTDIVNNDGKKIFVYGASTKGNCLLQYANLTEDKINYAVERNLSKVGKMTSTGIPIISEETMRNEPPHFLLVLPYHFKEEIIQREHEYLKNGGQLIFPFPHFEIVGSNPKLLITGCDGMISKYIKEQFVDYNLYGIGHNNITHEKNIIKTYFDMNNEEILENTLSIIKPDIIVHLASITSSKKAFNNPIQALKSNGMLTSHLCDIIHRNNWKTKLFNASSSEIYKGHIDYFVNEDDTHKYHLHPYSIAKIMGHSMIDFYRTTFNLPFSNGIIFTTESPFKSNEFLLNKIDEHAKTWNNTKESIVVGNLDSYRNIIHASDVANAIHLIISQNHGDNYVICGDNSYKIIELVTKIYNNHNIDVVINDNEMREKESNDLILVIHDDVIFNRDVVPSNIRGNALKLKKMGWLPSHHF